MNAYDIIIRPVVSEKSYGLMEQNRYTFEVHRSACKEEIGQAIHEIFGVTVIKVNTMNVSGKPRRVRYNKGLSRSWKKAIVSVKEGDTIDLFAGR
jgi:large subunit ribosomal protein L23